MMPSSCTAVSDEVTDDQTATALQLKEVSTLFTHVPCCVACGQQYVAQSKKVQHLSDKLSVTAHCKDSQPQTLPRQADLHAIHVYLICVPTIGPYLQESQSGSTQQQQASLASQMVRQIDAALASKAQAGSAIRISASQAKAIQAVLKRAEKVTAAETDTSCGHSALTCSHAIPISSTACLGDVQLMICHYVVRHIFSRHSCASADRPCASTDKLRV